MGIVTDNLVGAPGSVKYLAGLLAPKTLEGHEFDFVAANVTAGMLYGWELREELERLTGREVPFVYVRESQKRGGQEEFITGDSNNPLIQRGHKALIVESEENPDIFIVKVLDAIDRLKEAGYTPTQVATIIEPSDIAARILQGHRLTLSYSLKQSDILHDPEGKALVSLGTDGFGRRIQPRGFSYELADPIEVATRIVETGALEIRDIENGENPFLYSSGNRGPGYLMVKGLVGQPRLMKYLCAQVTLKIPKEQVDFVAGNVTGGLIPAWEIRNNLEGLKGEEVPFAYVEGSRIFSEGRMVGEELGRMRQGDRVLTVEELVNFAQTTTNSALLSRHKGYQANLAATILHYGNPVAVKQLEENGIELFYVTSLPHILDAAEKSPMFNPRAVADYRRFLENPLKWQVERGYMPEQAGYKAAQEGGTT